jgi:hypothetical protein
MGWSLKTSPQQHMKKLTLIALMGVLLLSGCASSQRNTAEPQPAVPAAQAVSIPAVSAKKIVLVISGSKASTESRDWAAFREEWRATFADHAREAGIAFSMQEAMPRAGDTGTTLALHINDYRLVGVGARIFLGVMTGNAYIDATVNYSDLKSGKAFGSQNYNTSSNAWHGVFGKMTPQQVDAIADGVFRELKAAR